MFASVQNYGACVRCIRDHVAELELDPCSRQFSIQFCANDVDSFDPNPVLPLQTSTSKCLAAQKSICKSKKGQRCLKCIRSAVADGNTELAGCSKALNDIFCETGKSDAEIQLERHRLQTAAAATPQNAGREGSTATEKGGGTTTKEKGQDPEKDEEPQCATMNDQLDDLTT